MTGCTTTSAKTPEPPYYAVIFTNEHTGVNEGYSSTGDSMMILASKQPGYLGVESFRNDIGKFIESLGMILIVFTIKEISKYCK